MSKAVKPGNLESVYWSCVRKDVRDLGRADEGEKRGGAEFLPRAIQSSAVVPSCDSGASPCAILHSPGPFLLTCLTGSFGARCRRSSEAQGKPEGQEVKLPVTRDTWFSQVGNEATCNLGGSSQLKLKSIQEMSLIDVDPQTIKGRVINGATLYLRLKGQPHLKRVTVSSFAADWVEGTSPDLRGAEGQLDVQRPPVSRRAVDRRWQRSRRRHAGQGGTRWRMADAFPPDDKGWQKIAVDPSIVALRAPASATASSSSTTPAPNGRARARRSRIQHFPNRFVSSREDGAAKAPYLIVFLGAKDDQPPAAARPS